MGVVGTDESMLGRFGMPIAFRGKARAAQTDTRTSLVW
jgi:hypothetical protein